MKDSVKYTLLAVIFVLVIAIAGLTYYSLSSEYEKDIMEQKGKYEMSTDFTVLNSEGNKAKLSDFYGKPTVVNFWATWCGPCKSEFPAFQDMYEKYGDRVNFMMVNMTDGYRDTVEVAKDFVSENGYTFPVYFDTEYEAAYAYNISGIPLTLFVNSDGYIIRSYNSAMSETMLERFMEELMGGEQ